MLLGSTLFTTALAADKPRLNQSIKNSAVMSCWCSGRSHNQLKPMTNFKKGCRCSRWRCCSLYRCCLAAPVSQKAVEGNHANYASHWLLIQSFTTAPAFEVTPTAGNPEGAGLGPSAEGAGCPWPDSPNHGPSPSGDQTAGLIEQNNFAFVKPSTGSQLIPVPNAEVCKTAGELAVDKLTVPSKMTSASYTCMPGR